MQRVPAHTLDFITRAAIGSRDFRIVCLIGNRRADLQIRSFHGARVATS
jgi:hypothetical protein